MRFCLRVLMLGLRFAARLAFCLCSGWIRNGLSLLRLTRVKKKHIGWLAMLQCNILHWAFWVMTFQVGDELS
jgi:hypothetical protein